jgi:hypothetical protein
MATRIVTKSGSGAPTTDDLIAGELAVDLTNGRLYTEDLGGTVLELGLNPSGNVDVTGTVTATGTSVFASLDISGDIDVDGTANLDVVDIDGAVDMASTLAVATRVGIGVAAHASAALNITTTDQHIRLSNGSELGVIELDSDGELNIWAHGDGETINLKTGSGAGTDVLSVVGSDVGIGTSSPSYNAKLDVNGIIIANVGSGGLSLSGNAAPDISYVSYNYTNSNGTEVVPQSIRPSHRMSMGNGAQDAITFDYRAANAAAGTWQERMRIDASGRVGIGTSLPTGKLSILGGSLPTADSGYSLSLSSALSATRLTTDASSGTSFIGSYYDSTSLEISQGVSAGYTTGIVLGARNATNATVSDAIAFYTRSAECMRIDSSGRVTMPFQPAFYATPSVTQTDLPATDSAVTVAMGTEIFDVGSNFASNTFTAPVTGKYQLNLSLYLKNVDTAASYILVGIATSNRGYINIVAPNYTSDLSYLTQNISTLADMDAGDTAYVFYQQSGGAAQTDIDADARASFFQGYLVA